MVRGNSGRGRGRGRYSGRGRQSNKTKSQATTEDVTKLKFQVGTAKQASQFTKIKKHCINNFAKGLTQGHFIAAAMEDLRDYDFSGEDPGELELKEETGDAAKILKVKSANKKREIDYRIKSENHQEMMKTFKENKFKVYAYLWDKCSTQMKQNLEAKDDFKTKIKNNPCESLKAIKGPSYNHQETKCGLAIIHDAIKSFVSCSKEMNKI